MASGLSRLRIKTRSLFSRPPTAGNRAGSRIHKGSEGLYVWISPHSRRILTRRNPVEASDSKPLKGIFRLWEADPWHQAPDPFLDQLIGNRGARFLADDLIEIVDLGVEVEERSESLYRIGGSSSPTPSGANFSGAKLDGELVRYNGAEVLDIRSSKTTLTSGRPKVPSLAERPATDGRFVLSGDGVIDTVTEKNISLAWNWSVNAPSSSQDSEPLR